jgi:RNA polymerase sigma-70 factor (ECF subfamily)
VDGVIASYRELARIAQRWSSRREDVEDVVQESLLAAHVAGKTDLDDEANRRWIAAVIRNQARLLSRGSARRRARETRWHADQPASSSGHAPSTESFDGSELPPALRAVARLVLGGLDRREIAHLLGLTDQVLRKRVSGLAKRLARHRGAQRSEPDHVLTLSLAYGRIRQALMPLLRRHDAHFATHDPDGHLLIIRRA